MNVYPSIELDADCSFVVINDHLGHMCIDDGVQVLSMAVVSEEGLGSGASCPSSDSSLWNGEAGLTCAINVNVRISV